jgi:hypothetical protein
MQYRGTKRERMENERRASTYFQHGLASLNEDRGGRFSALEDSSTVTGSGPISYPQQPGTSPFHCDPVPDEPPLGFRIDDQEAVGEKFEQDRQHPLVPAAVGDGAKEAGTASVSPVIPKGFRRRI